MCIGVVLAVTTGSLGLWLSIFCVILLRSSILSVAISVLVLEVVASLLVLHHLHHLHHLSHHWVLLLTAHVIVGVLGLVVHLLTILLSVSVHGHHIFHHAHHHLRVETIITSSAIAVVVPLREAIEGFATVFTISSS